jgi:SanA protein
MKALRVLVFGAGLIVMTLGALLALVAMSGTAIDAWGRAYLVDASHKLPKVDAVLVLGTSLYDRRGQTHWTLSHRVDAAAGLWHGGLADRFLVSGSSYDDGYDEARDMRDEMVARGVPAGVIELDPLSYRTWHSVVRARHVFGKRRLLIVSQPDHLARALFLARHIGIEAWGVPARGMNYSGLPGAVMRDLACLAAYVDVVLGLPARVIAAAPPR